jgi:hypothetical protein
MDNNKKNGLANLTKKAAAIFGASIAALTGVQTTASVSAQVDNLDSKTIQVKGISKVKPMPVLKLNMHDPENSQFVASHASHRSHRSHRSHFSHMSGAMFS